MQIFTRMQLKADVDALLVEGVQNRPPATGQLAKGLFKARLVVRRPGVHERPGQRSGEGGMGG
ncbi:hypothetical protein D3C75_1042840 [compost metagenome]